MKLSEKIINHQIIDIFPTPIYITKLNRDLTKEELLFVDKTKLDVYKNIGNTTSNDNYILNNKIFENLKINLDLIVKDYFDKIICSANDIKPYITQSWLNFTETNQYHSKHRHSNSLVSGVFYINCDEKFDRIGFFKNDYNTIKLKIKEYNFWNAESWWLTVKTGDILLFPSSLTHMVETKERTDTRISLAFNIFIKGTIGEYGTSTELKL